MMTTLRIVLCRGSGRKDTLGTRSPFYVAEYIQKECSQLASLPKEIVYCRFFKSLKLFRIVDLGGGWQCGVEGIPGLSG